MVAGMIWGRIRILLVAILLGISGLGMCQNLEENVRENRVLSGGLEAGGLNIKIAPVMPEMPKNIRIRANFFRWKNEQKLLKYEGLVQIFGDNGLQMFADRAELDFKSKVVMVFGNVEIYQGALVYKGQRASYFYDKGKLDTKDLIVSLDPILLKSGSVKQVKHRGRDVFVAREAAITTHDVKKPNYWLEADKITIYPKEKVTFNKLRFKVGDRTVLWLPYFSQSLNKDLGYHFIPGSRSNWGPFLMNRYGVMLGGELDKETEQREDAWLLAQFLFDARYERGLGAGVDLFDTRLEDNDNLGWLKMYYTNDLDPSQTRSGEVRGPVNEDRYRVEFKNRFEQASMVNNAATFYSDINMTWLSDRFYLEDFEPRTFTTNPQPENILGAFRKTESSLAGIYGRFRLNDFYRTDSRLPEIFYERTRRPIKESKVLYQGSTSAGFYREDLADFRQDRLRAVQGTLLAGDPRISEIDSILSKRDFLRFHTWHEVSRTFRPFNGVTVTPRAGLGYTQYWQEGADDKGASRRLASVGVDSSLKFVKQYPGLVNKKWGLDGLMHVSRPYANLSLLSTNQLDSSFTKIDRLTPTTRPRTIDVGSFSAIDEINSWSIVRLGINNELLTRRDGGSYAWLTMNTYLDYFMRDPEQNRSFSNLYNDIYWHPLPWMAASVEMQFPLLDKGSGFTELAPGVQFMANENWEVSFNYRLLNGHPTLEDSNRIDMRIYTRLNESWGFDIYQQWELDDNTLEMQQYRIHRDFDSWIASLGVLKRDNRNRDEFSVLLSFTLKDFPSINLPLTIDQKEN
jgi:LPS-assembly protein